MDAERVRALLQQHFTSGDPHESHAIYQDDAVLEFPQPPGWRARWRAAP
jgi:hypothetical protein